MTREEIFELINATRREHVLLGSHTRNRGLVHANDLGDVVQNHRFHRFLAVLKEISLPVDDTVRHLEERLAAALEAFDEPTRF